MNDMVLAATAEIRRRWPTIPRAALVLGTGLGQLAEQISVEVQIPYSQIPGFARTTAIAHRGQLVCGTLSGVPIMLLNGRCHFYEGVSYYDVTLPIRVLDACGAETLIVTNAAGGLNRQFAPGDIMVIEDHINLLGRFTLCPNSQRPSLRSPQAARTPYDPALIESALTVSRRHQFVAHQGVYAAVTGPNYETRAEYSFLRRIGADVVGMSTVPEVQVAWQMGLRILGLSIVTNVAHIEVPEVVNAQHVVTAAQRAEPNVRAIVEDCIQSL